jgi:hydroxyacylglutathione hydrolase
MFSNLVPTSSIAPHLYALRTKYVNFYIFKEKNNAICFDTGLSCPLVNKELQKIKISPDQVSHIFLTHSDKDHVGGISVFPNAKIFLSKLEVPLINGIKKRALFKKNQDIEREYQTLSENEVIQVGSIEIKAISTPGHTLGSMSYFVNNKFLFSGDTIYLKKNNATAGVRFLNMDIMEQKQSISKLSKIENVELLCTAHSGITQDFDFAMTDWKKIF